VRNRARAVGILLLAGTFAVGALGGMAMEEAMGLDWFDFLDEDATPSEDRLFAGVELSREQRARIEEIRDRREDRLEAYWESRVPEIQRIVDQSYGEMRAVLPPERHADFDRRVRELRARTPADSD
jgi:Spy/CpxP family protein refolding chaperone